MSIKPVVWPTCGGGNANATTTQTPLQAPGQDAQIGASQISEGLPYQRDINDGQVRDRALAQRSLDRLKQLAARFPTTAEARAAGYHPNASAADHFINDNVFRERNGWDLDRPATLMYEKNQLVGVMLSHDPRKGAPPDFGAGSWHTHGGTAGEELALHVRFDRPIDRAFGRETGDV